MLGDCSNDPQSKFNSGRLNKFGERPPLKSDRRNQPAIKLYITKLPAEITLEDITAIFTNYGQPFNIYLHNQHHFAFVEYATELEANTAMSRLNNASPYHFRISIAKDKERKMPGDTFGSKDCAIEKTDSMHFAYTKGSMSGQCSSGGMAGSEFLSQRTEFINDDPLLVMRNGNEGFPNRHRYLCSESNPQPIGKTYPDMDVSEAVAGAPHFKVVPYNETERHMIMRALDIVYMKRQEKKTIDYCFVCGFVTSKQCSRCCTPYCSPECQKKDWPHHEAECRQKALKTTPRDTPPTWDARSVASEFNGPGNHAENKKSDFKDKGSVPYSNRFPPKSVSVSESRPEGQGGNKLSRTIDDKPFQKNYDDSRRGKFGDSFNKKTWPSPSDDGRRTSRNEVAKNDKSKCNGSNEKKWPESSPNKFSKSSSPKTNASKDSSYKNEEVASPVVANGKEQSQTNQNLERFIGQTWDITITEKDSENRYWVWEQVDIKNIQEMQKVLGDECKGYPDVQPELGKVYGCSYDGEWWRGKVISIHPKIKIHYIDFGNTADYDFDVVKELPQELKTLPGLAYLVEFAEGTSNKYTKENLQFQTKLKVKIVQIKPEEVYVVEIVGEKSSAPALKPSVSSAQTPSEPVIKIPPKPEPNKIAEPAPAKALEVGLNKVAECAPNKGVAVNSPPRAAYSRRRFLSKFDGTDLASKNPVDGPRKSAFDFLHVGDNGLLVFNETDSTVAFGSVIPNADKNAEFSYERLTELSNPTGRGIKAKKGDVVLLRGDANTETNLGHRGIILHAAETNYKVDLIDVAKVVTVTDVYSIPEDIADMTDLGVKIHIIEETEPGFLKKVIGSGNEVAMYYTVTGPMKDNRWPCVVTKTDKSGDTIGTFYLERWKPPVCLPTVSLAQKSSVVISSFKNANTVFVRPLEPSAVKGFMALNIEINEYAFKAKPFDRVPEVGELCCAEFELDGHFYRAQVKLLDETKTKATVIFVDFGNPQETPLKKLLPLPDHLKIQPCYAVRLTLKDVEVTKPNAKVADYLMLLLNDEIGLSVEFHESTTKEAVLTEVATDVCVNQRVNELSSSFPRKKLDVPAPTVEKKTEPRTEPKVEEENYLTDRELKLLKLNVGENRTMGILYLQDSEFMDHGAFWATDVDHPSFEKVSGEVRERINKHCTMLRNQSYHPKEGELCLALFEGEWYRAVSIGNTDSSTFEVFFLDFGNTEKLESSCIRKMEPEFIIEPALAVQCIIHGYARVNGKTQLEKKILSHMSKLVNSVVKEVQVVSAGDECYEVILPEIETFISGGR